MTFPKSGIPSGTSLEMRWMNCIMGEKEDCGTPAASDQNRSK